MARLLPHPDRRRGEIRIGEATDGNGFVSSTCRPNAESWKLGATFPIG